MTMPLSGMRAGSAQDNATQVPPVQPIANAHVRHAREREIHTLRKPALKYTRMQLLSIALLLVFAAAMFFINLTASGYANEFYSAAAQAGASNWEAFLWGSSDAGNSITVDKPPAAIWLMALSVRVFGLNSFAILLPQALLGVASVALVYAAVRRYWGHGAGLLAGFTLALTPVAVLMFRFNNPDALLVFLEIATIYAVGRALEYDNTKLGNRRRTWWMVLAGVAVGFGFLTKQLQVMLILPGIALAFLMASPTGWGRRILDSIAALASMVVAAGWWVALTVLVPADKRPYIGGSQTNSFLELTFGYNGFGRLTGNETGSVVPGGGGASGAGGTGAPGGAGGGSMWGQTGITRLFTDTYATQITWLAIIAFAGIVLGLVVARHTLRTDMRRVSTLLWGSWLVVTWLVLSFMAGIFHQYYTVALAPALAALVAIAFAVLWNKRKTFWARLTAALLVAVNTVWTVHLLSSSSWLPWLVVVVGIAGAAGTLGLAMLALAAYPSRRLAAWRTPARSGVVKILAWVSIALGAVALYAGPAAWSGYTVATGHHGSIVTAGPESAGGPGGGMGGGRGQGGPGGNGGPGGATGQGMSNQNGSNSQSAGNSQTGNGGMQLPQGQMGQSQAQQGQGAPGQSANGQRSSGLGSAGAGMQNGPMSNNSQQSDGSAQTDGNTQSDGSSQGSSSDGNGQQSNGSNSQGAQGTPMGGSEGQRGGGSSLLGGGQTSSKVVNLLKKNADSYTWVAATTGSQSAAGYQLAVNAAVMPIGGFNGSDPSPTLAQFKKLVKQGKIHYYIASGGIGGNQMGGSQAASEIAQWVEENFTAQTVDGVTLYDLTQSQN